MPRPAHGAAPAASPPPVPRFPAVPEDALSTADASATLEHARAAATAEARLLRLALESARVLVWRMELASGRIRYHEDPETLLEMGFRPEILPRTVDGWRALLHPEDRERIHQRLVQVFAAGGTFEEEYRVVLPGAEIEVHWVETRGRVDDEGGVARMLGVTLDTTLRRLAAETLREREETLDAVFAASPDPIHILDTSGCVQMSSPAVRSVFGYAPDEHQGQSTLKFVHPEDRPAVEEAIRQAVASGDGTRVRARYLHADGRWLTVEADGRRLTDGHGHPTGLVVVSRDVTEQARLEQALREARDHLEEKVRDRTAALEMSQLEILERLARAAEFRDDDTGRHTRRVGRNAARLAQALGLPREQVNLMRRAAPLHDVGKIGLPDHIFLKPGRCTPEEFEVIRSHTLIGAKILSGGQFPLLRMAEQIALTHHERWDGRGYPHGLAGEDIPLVGRIVSVVDVFDALTHARPYKPAWPVAQALEEIRNQRGAQFDPAVADAFLALYPSRR